MVRNTKGGNGNKKVARKHTQEENVRVKTRLANPSEPCEMYATVSKMFGQGNCEVLCNDGKHRLCVIRKKFKGRNKSKNHLALDTKVLVGLRDWEIIGQGKKEKCDLLEVYERSQHMDIKKDKNCVWSVISSSVEKDLVERAQDGEFEFEFEVSLENNIVDGGGDGGTSGIGSGNGSGGIGSSNHIDDINFDDI